MMKRVRHFLLLFCIAILATMRMGTLVPAAETSESSEAILENVDLYYMNYGSDVTDITIPENLMQSYQIPVPEGAVATYKVQSGSSAEVSDTGLITPKIKYTYWVGNIGYSYSTGNPNERVTQSYKSGTTKIAVTIDDVTTTIHVNVVDYAKIYADDLVRKVAAEIKAENAAQADQFKAAVIYVAHNYDYSAKYSSYIPMIITGGADCWGSVSFVTQLCDQLGIENYIRNAAADPLAGSGHRNVVAVCDGVMYLGDAGYSGSKPRTYSFKKFEDGFSIRDKSDGEKMLYQYDGLKSDVVIPEGVTTLGNGSRTVFGYSHVDVTSITLSSTVSKISPFAFYCTGKLKEIKVSPNNPYFTSIDGVLYTKDKKEIVAYPDGKKAAVFNIPGHVTTVGEACFYYVTCLEQIIIPETVTTIKEGAFFATRLEKLTIPKSVKTIGSNTFYTIKELHVKASQAELGTELCTKSTTVYCTKGSTFETYAKNNSIPYVIIEEVGTAVKSAKVTSTSGTVPKNGTFTVTDNNPANPTMSFDGVKSATAKAVKIPDTVTYNGVTYKVTTVSVSSFTSTKDKAKFKVTSNKVGSLTVEYKAPTNKKKTNVSIPKYVTYKGIKFKVTSVASNAFKNNKYVKKVTIPDTVTRIGAKAFSGCRKLTKVTIGKRVQTIDKYAFYGCKKLTDITIKSTKLQTVGKYALKGVNAKCKIKVPASRFKSYKKLLKNKGQKKTVKITK